MHSQCSHSDIRLFDGIRCCLSCGLALLDTPSSLETALSEISVDFEPNQLYSFQPLNYELGQEIRLVVLYPGRREDDLVCNIIHVNLLDKPVYQAVSYTWADESGDDALCKAVYCPQKTLRISKNCDAALRRLRRRGSSRVLWIDSICIDQINIGERNHQVEHMAAIYSQASQVLIYVGEATLDSDSVMSWLSDEGTSDFLPIGLPVQENRDLEAVNSFLNRRWFHRLWVIQEVALANRALLICGTKSVSWTWWIIERLNSVVRRYWSMSYSKPTSLLRWSPGYICGTDFLKVLHDARGASASDERDKVFALRGLVQHCCPEAPLPDYSKSADDIFIGLAVKSIQQRNSLDILSYGDRHWNLDLSSSSWIPRWTDRYLDPLPPQFSNRDLKLLQHWPLDSQPNEESNAIIKNCATTDRFRITYSTLQSMPISRMPWPTLHVKARRLDTVYRLRPIGFQFRDNDYALGNIRFWEMLRWNELEGQAPGSLSELSVERYPSIFGSNKFCSKCIQAAPRIVEYCKDQLDSFVKQLREHGAERVVFQTYDSLGLGPPTTYLQDTVWALDGAKVPFVLRQRDDRRYSLIGECYFHGGLRQRYKCDTCDEILQGPPESKTQIIGIV